MNLPISVIASLFALWVGVANAGVYVDKVEHPKKVVVFKIQGEISHTDVSAFQNALYEIDISIGFLSA